MITLHTNICSSFPNPVDIIDRLGGLYEEDIQRLVSLVLSQPDGPRKYELIQVCTNTKG